MTYIDGFVIPVKTVNKTAFLHHARTVDIFFIDYGALRVVECWQNEGPDDALAEFKRAVAAEDDESIVFSWIEWPDKATRDAGYEAMESNEAMNAQPMPFDGKRMIYAGFEAVVDQHWKRDGLSYVDGYIGPVADGKKDAYIAMSEETAAVYRDNGALFDIESWGDDVPEGKVTDFRRAAKLEAGETVAFAVVGWPDKATRDAAWDEMMKMPPPAEMPFDMTRVMMGSFTVIFDTQEV